MAKEVFYVINKSKRLRPIMIVIFLLLLIILPPMSNDYIINLGVITGIWVILTLGLNIIMGYGGQVNIAQGALYGVGAYASAILTVKIQFPFILSLFLSGLIAAAIGLIFGYLTLRTAGLYFTVTTLGLGIIFHDIFLNWLGLTGGPMGFPGISRPGPINLGFLEIDFYNTLPFYYLVFILVIATFILLNIFIKSPFGKILVSIREDEMLARSMGINVVSYKLIGFVLSSFFAGVAGSLYAHYIGFISPESFNLFASSLQAFVIVTVGGAGFMYGPVVGAILLTGLPELLRMAPEFKGLIYGILLLLVNLFMPEGIVGRINSYLKSTKLRQKGDLQTKSTKKLKKFKEGI
ncbi:branched-chain amino acid ABC transporter permease [Neobacillus sp. SAB-20_R2A]|uniref:branched-chain amino acid ABC transporter permease n=1 Tax=Neobacillus sp. SAB-20_R2A TaxID=3120519 RepID=UPI003C6E7B01